MNEKTDETDKKIKLSRSTIIMIILVTFVVGCRVMFFIQEKSEDKKPPPQSINRDDSQSGEDEVNADISPDEALDIAIIEFEQLGEKNLNKEELRLDKVVREGIEYYKIYSANNSIEIIVAGGEVSRINW